MPPFENPQHVRLTLQSVSLISQFEQLGDLEYLERASASPNEAIALTPVDHPDRSVVLQALAEVLMLRFRHCGDVEDTKKATVYRIEAVYIVPEELVALMLNFLGIVYVHRFSAFGRSEDLELSLFFKAQAIHYARPDADHLPGFFNEFGLSLGLRFKITRDTKDNDHAVVFQERSLVGTRLHDEYPKWLMNLGATLRDRFQYLDMTEDIERSIKCLRQVAGLIPDNHIAMKAMCRNILVSALGDRFDHRGKLADLDESISILNETILRGPGGYPEQARSLNILGHCLQQRFERLGDIDDINRAVVRQEQSISMSPTNSDSHPGWYNNLGNSLMCRYKQLRDPIDLNKAIRCMEKVIEITSPSDMLRSAALSNLGTLYSLRFKAGGEIEDIDASIKYLNEAISSTHGSNARRATWLGNLGGSYLDRFRHSRRIADLDNAIMYRKHACSLIPERHIDRPEALRYLGEL